MTEIQVSRISKACRPIVHRPQAALTDAALDDTQGVIVAGILRPGGGEPECRIRKETEP